MLLILLIAVCICFNMATATEEQYLEKVPALREFFFSKYADSVSSDAYDELDVIRIREDDRYVQCYMRSFSVDLEVEEPAANIDKVLRWRKELAINQFKIDDIPKELSESNYIYWHGVDKEQRKILMLKVARHKKGFHIEETKRHIAYMMDQHHKLTPGDPDRIIFLFDFTGAGVTNVDLDVVKFIISALSNYFPSLLHQILLFEMPWLLGAVWKVIQSWLSKEQKARIKKVSKSDINEYIAEDQLEDAMKSSKKK